jgi:hypothetical protein
MLWCPGAQFCDNNNPTLLNNVAIAVIKDQYQYRYQGHCFDEAEVLCHIHAEEDILGVAYSEDVIRSDGTPVSDSLLAIDVKGV